MESNKLDQLISYVVEKALTKTSSKQTGHFVLKNAGKLKAAGQETPAGMGDHSDTYFDKDRITKHSMIMDRIGLLLAVRVYMLSRDIRVVACPAIGAIKLSEAVAKYLSILCGEEVLTVYAEDVGGKKVFKRSDFAKVFFGKNVLVVEDIWTTGGSLQEVADAVRKACGFTEIAAVLIARGDASAQQIGVDHLLCMYKVENINKWDPDECPLCKDNVAVNTDVGKGLAFIDLKT